MKNTLRLAFALSALVVCSVSAAGQKKDTSSAHRGGSNPGVVIVGSAAKGAWVMTKFTTATVAKPVVKAVLLKVTPAVSMFLVKNAAKELLPIALKLAVL